MAKTSSVPKQLQPWSECWTQAKKDYAHHVSSGGKKTDFTFKYSGKPGVTYRVERSTRGGKILIAKKVPKRSRSPSKHSKKSPKHSKKSPKHSKKSPKHSKKK